MVFHFTETTLSIAPERVTVKVIVSPSEALASATENEGCVSSFFIVPVALPLPDSMVTPVAGSSCAFAGLLSTALNVSSGSKRSSSAVATITVLLVSVAAKLSVREERAV